jgi:hypothetical protein
VAGEVYVLKYILKYSLTVISERNNEAWKTYGPAPNLAYLIGTDKKIIVAQQWQNAIEMETTIKQIK